VLLDDGAKTGNWAKGFRRRRTIRSAASPPVGPSRHEEPKWRPGQQQPILRPE